MERVHELVLGRGKWLPAGASGGGGAHRLALAAGSSVAALPLFHPRALSVLRSAGGHRRRKSTRLLGGVAGGGLVGRIFGAPPSCVGRALLRQLRPRRRVAVPRPGTRTFAALSRPGQRHHNCTDAPHRRRPHRTDPHGPHGPEHGPIPRVENGTQYGRADTEKHAWRGYDQARRDVVSFVVHACSAIHVLPGCRLSTHQ
mmetsp:Transcript_13774/g.46415  ORF Transcript_13774/g.46415 Transcript_13774/m.46415 type:complete len:200 (+) Transcript_13774:81-680(+)